MGVSGARTAPLPRPRWIGPPARLSSHATDPGKTHAAPPGCYREGVNRLERGLAWGGALGLLVLHCDFWRPQRPVLHLEAIPEELLYRLGWMVLAMAYLQFFCSRIWRDREGRP